MENYCTPSKSPSKLLDKLPKELREVVKSKNNPQSSPFCLLPSHITTPPSRFNKIKNPFEAAINDQLHKHIFSPSVFAEVQNPRNSEKFKWTIDEVASLRPAQIDENTIAQFEQTAEDDVHVQAKIERYFSETHIVPSPYGAEVHQSPLLQETESPGVKSAPAEREMCNVWTQTVLSLPPKLPEAVEKILFPFFSFTEDQRRQSVDFDSSLRRRLFNFEEGTDSNEYDSSIHSDLSAIGSPIIEQKESDKRKRTYDSSPEIQNNIIPPELSPIPSSTPQKLNNCPISPIILNMEHIQCRDSNSVPDDDSLSPISEGINLRSFVKVDLSGHMSVDNSFNLAPENDFTPGNATHLSESPVREFMDSSCNWDLEYNNISINNRPIRRSLFETRNLAEKMDISNLTTPKSKIMQSQRKKLSDSFKFTESLSDDENLHFDVQENVPKFRKFFHETLENTKLEKECCNSQDTGYNTELSQKSNLNDESEEINLKNTEPCRESKENYDENKENEENFEENEDIDMTDEDLKENWSIYASTPSKRYFSNLENKLK